MTLLGGSPFYKGQKIAPLYMQSPVPSAIAIIENLALRETTTRPLSTKQLKWQTSEVFLAVHILRFFSQFLNNFRAKIFRKIHRHASAYFCIHCGKIGLEVHANLVLNSLMYFRSISQGSYPFSETNFQDFFRTFQGLRLIFQGL